MGGAAIKFVGEALMLWGMWEKVKTVGELKKSMGESFRGGCYGGVLIMSRLTNLLLKLLRLAPKP